MANHFCIDKLVLKLEEFFQLPSHQRSGLDHNFLYQTSREQSPKVRDFTLEQKKDIPPTNLRYSLKKVSDGVFKNQKNLYRQEVTIIAQDRKIPKDSLVTYLFKPVEINNEKK